MAASLFRKKRAKEYEGAAKQVAFVVGTGRCGTTILSQVLNAHSKVCVPPEMQIMVSVGNGERFYEKFTSGEMKGYKAKDLISLFERCCPYDFEKFFDYRSHFKSLSYPRTDLAGLLKDLMDHICYAHGKEVFVEQTPWQGQRLDTLKSLFPEARVVHMVRDGRDVALSFARSPWWSDSVEENIVQWEKEAVAIHEFGRRHPENFIELRYEDLVEAPERELRRVLALFGLDFEAGMLDPANLTDYMSMFKGNMAGRTSRGFKDWSEKKKEVFFKGSVYSWKRNEEHDFGALTEKVADTLGLFGYETEVTR